MKPIHFKFAKVGGKEEYTFFFLKKQNKIVLSFYPKIYFFSP